MPASVGQQKLFHWQCTVQLTYYNSDCPKTLHMADEYKKLSYGRETARSLIHFRLTSSVIRKIMHKIGLLGHPVGASGAIYALYLKF